jgi:HSP20 family molecular chaperone IbpA
MPRDVNALWAQAMSEFEEMDNFLRHLDDGWSLAATLPAGDMREEADRYVVLFSMPGLSRSNTTVTLEGRLLTVSINVTDQARSYANSYGFSLPGPVKDGAHAEAVLSNGVLRVVIPKGRREESKGPRLSSLF